MGMIPANNSLGAKSKRVVEPTRKQVAIDIGAEFLEIVFTSSDLETNKWLIHSVSTTCRSESAHIITPNIVRPSVLIQIPYGGYNTINEVEIIVKAVCDAHDKIKANR